MKKILSILIITAMVLGLFVGCGKKEEVVRTSQEIFEAAKEKSKDIKNAAFDAEITVEVGGLDPSLGLNAPISLIMSGQMTDVKNMQINLDVDTGQGMNIYGEIFLKDEMILIHAPLLATFLGSEYVKMDMAKLSETAGVDFSAATMDQEKVLAVLDKFSEEKGYTIFDMLKVNDAVEEVEIIINENDESIKTKKIVSNIDVLKAVDLGLAFLEYVSENEEAQSVLFANLSQEEIDKAIAEIKSEEFRASIDEALKLLVINKFEYVLYVNDEDIPVKVEFDLDANVTDEEEVVNLKVSGFNTMYKIGEIEEIILPKVDETEILDLNDLY